MPHFSVIVATRNRPYQFAEALKSIMAQTCASKEIIVVNDGSDDDAVSIYQTLIEQAGPEVTLHSLIKRPNGHGPSFSRNYGFSVSKGEYLCFLDDDDSWTDDDYLTRVQTAISKLEIKPELILSNQFAYMDGIKNNGDIWLEGLIIELVRRDAANYIDEFYRVNTNDLLKYGGLCHLNTLIVRRDLYESVDGMDECIRWEEDRDIFLRLVDSAKLIIFSPHYVSRHNIPKRECALNASTSLNEYRKRQYQLYLFDKSIIQSKQSVIVKYAKKQKGYVLKHIALLCAKNKNYINAAFYAKQALVVLPSIKWLLYTGYLIARSLTSK
ncbi:glycosyltransferase family 2 protein [Acidihalobacter aeolianus]|uniref:glycosyltransferase family 2 protein n=1 Tax=Acidihalobacter aeolianus TaxID=2792603 RepID=UPI0009F2C430|nr:glycosyltransferase family 2 protein [Acidihalobacter aeolianus]